MEHQPLLHIELAGECLMDLEILAEHLVHVSISLPGSVEGILGLYTYGVHGTCSEQFCYLIGIGFI